MSSLHPVVQPDPRLPPHLLEEPPQQSLLPPLFFFDEQENALVIKNPHFTHSDLQKTFSQLPQEILQRTKKVIFEECLIRDTTPLMHTPTSTHVECRTCLFLDSLAALSSLPHLSTLILQGCPALKHLDDLVGPFPLTSMHLENCMTLESIKGIEERFAIENLTIKDCPFLVTLSLIEKMTSLKQLTLSNVRTHYTIEKLLALPRLESLIINGNKIL